MTNDRIEREIDIDAPIDVVWAVITEPKHIADWFTDSAELDVRVGGEGTFTWDEKARHRPTAVNVRVERLDPPRFFSFRWNYPDGVEPDATNAPLVEFTLEQRGESTHLRLVESGLQAIARSQAEKETYLAEHSSGWDQVVGRLRSYAVEHRSAIVG
jgi:uncharacterized protein YndB with AHSA1/START domain